MATSGINTSGISVGSDGKISISGLSSGIDSKSIIEGLIAAKSIPVTKLQTKITANNTQAQAYKDLKTKVAAMTTALQALRGDTSFGATNVFNDKAASGTTSAASGTASDINSLVTVSVQNSAQVADHSIVIHSLAKSDQLRTDAVSSTNTALVSLGVTTGDVVINGKTINIDGDDTLLDLKSKINASGAGVTATIVSSDATHNYLVLTATASGTANAITFGAGQTAADLGFTTGAAATTHKNILQAPADAVIDVDGIIGITRSSNQISDVLDGITFSLLKAEPGTTINLSVQPDLNKIKAAVSDFVTAYNDLRDFYTAQRTPSDLNKDGTIDSSEVGPLAYDSTLRGIIDKLGQISATSLGDNAEGYKSLSQVGVVVGSDYKLQLDDSIFDGKLLTNVDAFKGLFSFGFSSSDSRVTNLAHTVNTQAGTYTVNIGGTDASGNITTANITADGSGAGGADNGSVSVLAKGFTATGATGANGLGIFFNGDASMGPVNGITLTVTRGVADSFYDFFNGLSQTNGGLDTQVTQLSDQNTSYQSQIDTMNVRLDQERQTLTAKFTAMETALAQLNSLKSTLTSYFDAQSSSSNS